MGNWSGGGWSVSGSNPHSGAGCFFSDGGPADTLALAEPVSDGRLVEFYARYSTDEDEDSSGIRHDVCYVDVRELDGWRTVDSLYGRQDSWARCRYRAECAVTGVRFRYVATASGGIYVDDVTLLGGLWGFESVTPEIADTNCLLYNLRGNQDGYQFFITAQDSWGNRSSISDGVRSAAFTSPAEPYSIPSPFSDSCLIVLDRSDASGPSDVSIYSLSGALVRRFPDALPPVHWDGRNEAGQPVADGIYIVVTMGGRVGRIAKVRR
jgi:hypothetical protein